MSANDAQTIGARPCMMRKVVMARLARLTLTPNDSATRSTVRKKMLLASGENIPDTEARIIINTFFRGEKIVYGSSLCAAVDCEPECSKPGQDAT